MACRTSGDIKTPEQLWQFLLEKRNGSGTVPEFRWEPWLHRDSRNAKEIDQTLRKGYFIHDLENFDAAFFGISPKEAEQMDPHQRLALELAWEALEHAGICPKSLSKSDTAVFMGVDSDDYSRLLLEDIPNIEPWMGIGTAAHGVANRISYHLDLMGASAAVDAACASSLVAVHHGSQAIQLRDSEVALVGGVNVLLAPALTRMLDKAGALSPDGICRSLDDAANGYARGEGGAILVLKRLSSAVRDGDHIWSVLKGSSVAQDGRTNGIMAPNSTAQELVGRQALSRAGLHPSSISYVEAHATSTPLGDPTEVSAIARLYGKGAGRSSRLPCMIGSIKPNVGHLEAASGAIGLIKAVLAVDKGEFAPQTLLNKPNSRMDWESSGLEIVRESTQWGEDDRGGPRRAAVCSYGYGGTVSHAIIEQYPSPHLGGASPILSMADESLLMFTMSATSEKRIITQAKGLRQWLASSDGRQADLRAVANTLAQRRATNTHRVAFLAKDHDGAIELLKQIEGNSFKKHDPVVMGRINASLPFQATCPVWVFSGHGAQWSGMGQELVHLPVFARVMMEIEATIQKEAGFSVSKALEYGELEDTGRIQIATFAIQYGLSCVLRSYGLKPGAIIGHSIGEICASVVAGCITPKEGALVVSRRSRLLSRVRSSGAMFLVQIPFQNVLEELSGRGDITAAIDSSPESCVVSGEAEVVKAYVQQLRDRGIESFEVNTDTAFHSPMLMHIAEPFYRELAGAIQPSPASIPLYSSSLQDSRADDLRDAEYWVRNMVNPVWLRGAVQAAHEDGHRTFLEISSHPILQQSIRETLRASGLEDRDAVTACTMRRNAAVDKTIKLAVAQLFVRGVQVDFESLLGHKSLWCKGVPLTPWDHRPYYRQVGTGTMGEAHTHDPDKHTLLGQRTSVAGTGVTLFTTRLSVENKPFPGDHPLDGTEIIPAGVYINTFHHATGARELHDLQLRVPVSITKTVQHIQVLVQRDEVSMASSSQETGSNLESKESWIPHASCKWASDGLTTRPPPAIDLDAIQSRIGTRLPDTFAVDFLASIGVSGIAYPWRVTEHYGNESEMLVKVKMLAEGDECSWDPFSWAPLVDAATSVGSSIFFTKPTLRIISAIGRVHLYSNDRLPGVIFLHVQRGQTMDRDTLEADVQILDKSGLMLAELRSMKLSEVETNAASSTGGLEGLVHQIDWIPARFSETPRSLGHIVIVSRHRKRREDVRSVLGATAKNVLLLDSASDPALKELLLAATAENITVIYIPGDLVPGTDVSTASEDYVWDTVSLLRLIVDHSSQELCKLFVVTDGVHSGASSSSLAHGSLVGLGRIVAAEHPDVWGGLIDNDRPDTSLLLALTYSKGHDVLRNIDGLPRQAVMRPLNRKLRRPPESKLTLMPKQHGTYIITGGLGYLGLETAEFLVKKGARRLLLISRRSLPPRSTWAELLAGQDEIASTLLRVQELERCGATITTLAMDIALPSAAQGLLAALDSMQLPQVMGVVHCAGILEDSLVLKTSRESFRRVMSPKISGALTLHRVFSPGSLDFMVLYSSIGQLVGTAGQASYGAGNAFLDALAAHRRTLNDNTVSMQFTALRGERGMGASTEFLKVELQSKGITDISVQEAFMAWEHLGRFNLASAVVTRCLTIAEGEDVAVPILSEVVRRRPRQPVNGEKAQQSNEGTNASPPKDSRPSDPEKLKSWVATRIRQCIATVLMMPDPSEIDDEVSVNDLGVDSVMTVALRKQFQNVFGVKVPPTLTWKHPTVKLLTPWFVQKLCPDESTG